MGKKTLVVLISNTSGNRQQVANQERASIWWQAQGMEPELVDGVAQKELRNQLFEVSGTRGNYPQFFLKDDDDDGIAFLGLFEDIELMNEMKTFTKKDLGLVTEEDDAHALQAEIPQPQTRELTTTEEDPSTPMLCWGCELPSWFPKLANPFLSAPDTDASTQ